MDEKPTRMRGSERRALILAQSKKVFARNGYQEASTSELARASGVTEPMLYKHFASKRALYLAVLDLLHEQFMERFTKMVEQKSARDLQESLGSLLLDYRDAAMQDHDGIHLLLDAALESDDPDVAVIMEAHNQRMYALVSGLLEKAREQGLVYRSLDLAAGTWGFLSLMFGLQYRARVGMFEQFNEQVIGEINRLWFQALKTG
ncbi:MAG TPA: TetR/AcrR family transcriptional regulator [Anaerolineales bacterium]|nr:TetR/AcrR family transcriptional regulator [Anaerolineales bacterium]